MILVNFKNYPEGQGANGVKLIKIIEEVVKMTGVPIIPIVSPFLASTVKAIMIGHVDLIEKEASTGYISMDEAKKLGVFGSLLNHSEHRLNPGTIKKILKAKPEGFVIVTCIQNLGQIERWGKSLKTDMIAFEPKALIGSKDKSVSTESPTIIKKIVELVKVPVLVGAGIKTSEDVRIAIKMGAKGILVSSAVVKANDPKKKLLELANGFSV